MTQASLQSALHRPSEIGIGDGTDHRAVPGNQNRGDVVEPLARRFRVLLQDDRTKAAGGEDLVERRRIESRRRGNTREDFRMADVFCPAEKGLEERQIERPESLGMGLADPRRGFQRRQR